MGWGNQFPAIYQLNALTKNQKNRSATRAVFNHLFPKTGDYKLGELCKRWGKPIEFDVKGKKYRYEPPWDQDPDNPDADVPWNQSQADEWARHCQNDIGNGEVVDVDQNNKLTSSNSSNIKNTLEQWINEAINNDVTIFYRFKRKKNWHKDKWAARRRKISGAKWKILVKGPGF